MSLSYTIQHAVATVEDVSVQVADKTHLSHQSTVPDDSGGVVSTYVINSGDPKLPATVIYRTALVEPKGKPSYRRISITMNTWAVQTDSVTGLDTVAPIQANMSFVLPQGISVEVADLNELAGNLYSLSYLSVTSKLRDTTWLSKLMFGISQLV